MISLKAKLSSEGTTGHTSAACGSTIWVQKTGELGCVKLKSTIPDSPEGKLKRLLIKLHKPTLIKIRHTDVNRFNLTMTFTSSLFFAG